MRHIRQLKILSPTTLERVGVALYFAAGSDMRVQRTNSVAYHMFDASSLRCIRSWPHTIVESKDLTSAREAFKVCPILELPREAVPK
jgi:hypothetical protein